MYGTVLYLYCIIIKIVYNIHQNQPASLRRSLPSMPECMHRLIASSHWIRNAKPPTNTCCTQAVQYSCIVQRDRKKFPGFRMKQIIKTTKPGCQLGVISNVRAAQRIIVESAEPFYSFQFIIIPRYCIPYVDTYPPNWPEAVSQVQFRSHLHIHTTTIGGSARTHVSGYEKHVNSVGMSATSRLSRTRHAVLEGQFVLRVKVKCFQMGAGAAH